MVDDRPREGDAPTVFLLLNVWAGDIVALGGQVRGFELGQRVVAANSAPCLQCFYCRRGRVNSSRCRHRHRRASVLVCR